MKFTALRFVLIVTTLLAAACGQVKFNPGDELAISHKQYDLNPSIGTVTITNDTNSEMTMQLSVSDPKFMLVSENCSSNPIAAKGTCLAEISYLSDVIGSDLGTLIVQFDTGDFASSTSLALNGTTSQKIGAGSDGQNFLYFGASVAIDGDWAIIGAPEESVTGPASGAVYVFHFNGVTWERTSKLIPSNSKAYDRFGGKVSISGDRFVASAQGYSDLGVNSGAAFIFRLNGNEWVQEAKVLASDGGSNHYFGSSIAIHKNIVVVSTEGKGVVYVYENNGGRWTQTQRLIGAGTLSNDWFGSSVAITDERIAVGASGVDVMGKDYGAAYIFSRNGTTWVEEARLLPSSGTTTTSFGISFGASIAIEGNLLVVGTPQSNESGEFSGSAYIYSYENEGWTEKAKTIPKDGKPYQGFGRSVSISDGQVLIGAPAQSSGIDSLASAYLFNLREEGWVQTQKLLPPDRSGRDDFGMSVAISGDRCVVGAKFGTEQGAVKRPGSAYMYRVGEKN